MHRQSGLVTHRYSFGRQEMKLTGEQTWNKWGRDPCSSQLHHRHPTYTMAVRERGVLQSELLEQLTLGCCTAGMWWKNIRWDFLLSPSWIRELLRECCSCSLGKEANTGPKPKRSDLYLLYYFDSFIRKKKTVVPEWYDISNYTLTSLSFYLEAPLHMI